MFDCDILLAKLEVVWVTAVVAAAFFVRVASHDAMNELVTVMLRLSELRVRVTGMPLILIVVT
jgi:hypothetical protein